MGSVNRASKQELPVRMTQNAAEKSKNLSCLNRNEVTENGQKVTKGTCKFSRYTENNSCQSTKSCCEPLSKEEHGTEIPKPVKDVNGNYKIGQCGPK